MELKNLPEVEFCDADAQAVENYLLQKYKEITGRTLAKGDPVRLFLLTVASDIVLLLNKLNDTGKQNLLRYATAANLDHIGVLIGVNRIQAQPAVTTVAISLAQRITSAVIIPAGTRFTAGDNTFFALASPLVINPGETTAQGKAICTVLGDIGNNYAPNTITTLVDPVPFVNAVTNTTKSEGGAEIENDDDYRERIHLAPEEFSVAGPDGAYRYFTMQASSLIVDAAILSPEPGVVEVRPLLAGGILPETEMLEIVARALNDKNVRPLTDKVNVLAPTATNYKINVKYYINRHDATMATELQAAINAAISKFTAWQAEKLGRDINPSELIRAIMAAGAKRVELTSPSFTKLEETQVAICTETAVTFGGLENE